MDMQQAGQRMKGWTISNYSGNLNRFLNLLEFHSNLVWYPTIRLVRLIQIHVEVDGLANLCRLVRSGWKVPHSQMVRTGFPKSAHSTVRRFDDVPVTSSIHSTHITSHNCLHIYFNFLIFTKFHRRICGREQFFCSAFERLALNKFSRLATGDLSVVPIGWQPCPVLASAYDYVHTLDKTI